MEGKVVPVEVMCNLIKKGMTDHGGERKMYLIDDYPRNKDNLGVWQKILGDSVDTPFALLLETDEQTMIQRAREQSNG